MNNSLCHFCSVVLFSLLAFTACKNKGETTSPRIEKITESVYASGIIKSAGQYQVYPSVNGIVQEIFIQEGDLVKKGAALFAVRNESAMLNVDNARLSAAYADWNTQGARLTELQANVESAANVKTNDSILLNRQRRLWQQGINSKVALEQRELAYANSTNTYKAAVARYKDLTKQLGLASAQSKKQVAISQAIAKDFVVRSQLDGRIYSITKEVGEIVNIQNSIALIGEDDAFIVELQIDENDIIQVQKGQRVLLTLDSYKGEVFEAVVSRIDLVMNERTRTFTIDASFVIKPPSLYPNLTVEANIIIQERDSALLIPRSFLVGDSMVILRDQSTQKVQVGLKDYQSAEIQAGLTTKDVILKPVR